MALQLKIKKLHPDAVVPKYATAGAACFDLHAFRVYGSQYNHVTTEHGHPITCQTGLAFEVPEGHVMLIFSRSGHGFKQGLRLSNCVGVIDSDYRGEVCVQLTQDARYDAPHTEIKPGDRIAQAMLVPIPRVELIEVEELSDTERGAGGFGSTGV